MSECFIARSGLHYSAKDYLAALADIDSVLLFCSDSLPAIQRKVALLKRLGRGSDAYCFVDNILKSSTLSGTILEKNLVWLRQVKKDLKRFKRANIFYGNKQDDNDDEMLWPDHCLQVDSRLEWAQNKFNKRHFLKATETIPAETTLVLEDPALFVVRAESLHTHCNLCFVECANTCWPCEHCTEVIFCSKLCATRATRDYHQIECGIIGAMTRKNIIPAQALQVYRHLAKVGYSDLIKLDAAIREGNSPNLDELIGVEKMSGLEAQTLFAFCASYIS